MIEFSTVAWPDIVSQFRQIWPGHYGEVYHDGDYDPDWERYAHLAQQGAIHVTVGRKRDELVAYLVVHVGTHPLQQRVLWGFYDMYWIRPDCRAPGVFPRLLQACEDALTLLGVSKIYGTCPLEGPGRLFSKVGWTEKERTFTKVLQ